jgi:hypothetical protein
MFLLDSMTLLASLKFSIFRSRKSFHTNVRVRIMARQHRVCSYLALSWRYSELRPSASRGAAKHITLNLKTIVIEAGSRPFSEAYNKDIYYRVRY